MSVYATVGAVLFGLVCTPALAAEPLPLRDITADGTWDCKDPAGAYVGAIALADESYAFFTPDGKLGGYGKLYLIAEDTNTPKFAVIGGYLKDAVGARGLALTGPNGSYEDLSGELFLYVAVTTDRAKNWYCARRTVKGGAPETLRLVDVVADGTWDCVDQAGGDRGVVVLADTAYAYLKPDGRLGGTGKLFRLTENLDLPHYAEISGYLKDTFGAQGFAPRGPRDNPHDLGGQIYLNVIISHDGAGAEDWDCERRIVREG